MKSFYLKPANFQLYGAAKNVFTKEECDKIIELGLKLPREVGQPADCRLACADRGADAGRGAQKKRGRDDHQPGRGRRRWQRQHQAPERYRHQPARLSGQSVFGIDRDTGIRTGAADFFV